MDADETVPLASLGNVALPRITLQQAVRDGKEDVLRAWLARLANSSKKKQALNAKDSYGFTAMHYAARFNRFKIMSLLIAEEADPEALTDEGLTPLHYAARYTPLSQNDKEDDAAAPVTLRSNSRQIMELLVKICRVNVNVKDEYGSTPLHLACSRGNRAAVEVLLACETIDVNIPDVNLDTPLHDACLFGDAFIVEKLLENEADCLLANSDKDLPIHIACQEGLCDIVNQIMRRRFDQRANMLNMPDHEMNYPLHLACESGNAEIVKVLFLNGADPNITDNKGVTPLHVAAKEGFIDIAEVLLQYENADINVVDLDLMTPLHYAARHNKLEMMKFLLRKGADIQSQDRDSHTPLLKSVVYGNLPITDLLIKEGANPDDVDREGKSMVFIAAQENQSEILDCLISGVHEDLGRELVNTTDGTQNAPLHVACEKGNIESVKILLSCDRIKVDARNEADYTPLHLAAENGHSKIVKELCEYSLKKGMDIVKDEDDESNTPLHLACLNCHHKTAQVLIKFGAEHDARNGRLWTPLDCAAFVGKTKIVELLIRNEADIDSKDKKNVRDDERNELCNL
jgi:ankyrin repeat protein